MTRNVVIAADPLNNDQVRRVAAAAAAEGWATCTRLAQDSPELPAMLRDADVLVGWGPAAAIRAGKVSVYLCGSAGYDAYIGQGLDTKPDFRHCTAGTTMSGPIAEHCVALMFGLVRQVHTITRQQLRRHWERRWNVGEVVGTTACIVGLGSSGTELARRLLGLGMKVIGVRRHAERRHPLVGNVVPPERIADAVADADHVFCLLPASARTRHFFNAHVFAAMKRGTFFYSASRGVVTDERALTDALRNGQIGAAGLDVFESEPLPPASPLWDMDNVIVSPHSAGLSKYLNDRLADLFAQNLSNLRDGWPLVGEIDVRLLR